MKKKIFWVYISAVFVLFLAVGFIARQWFVGADPVSTGGSIGFGDLGWLDRCPSCPTMNLICDDADFPGGRGGYTQGCDLHLPVSSCELHGLTSYNNIRPNSLADDLDCSSIKIGNEQDAEECCTLTHELGHVCDPSDNDADRVNEACSEVFAEQKDDLCRNYQTEKFCPSGEHAELCKEMCDTALFKSIVKVWDASMCDSAVDSAGRTDGNTCCENLDQCKKSLERINKLIPEYCKDQNLVDYSRINQICEQRATTGGHNCDYWSALSLDEDKCQHTGFRLEQCNVRKENDCTLDNELPADFAKRNSDFGCQYIFGALFEGLNPSLKFVPSTSSSCPQFSNQWFLNYTCIASTCNLHTSTTGTATASSSTTSRAITESANAAAPLSEVTIKAQKDRGPYSITDNAIQTLGTTGTDGKLQMNLLLGSWKVTAEKSGYKTVNQYVKVEKDQPFNLNFNMTPDGTVVPPPAVADKTLNIVVRRQGYVAGYDGTNYHDSSSDAIQGATVKISKDSKNYTKTTAAPTGDVSFPNLETGIWNIEVTKPGYSVSPISPTTANVAYSTNQANIMMIEAQGSLTIRSVDQVNSSSNPISGVAVIIKQGEATKTQTTDSSGNTTFTDLIAGDWVVIGTKTNYHQEQDLTQSVYGDAPTADLVMDSDLKKLTVQVKMQSGTNVAKAMVKITGPGGELSKQTGTDGTTVFSNIKIGNWDVKATKSGYALANGQTASVNLQEDTTKALTALKAGTARFYIKGRTLGVSTPLPKATIELCNKPFTDSTKTCWKKTVNYIGMRTFQDMAPGTYYYEAKATNYATVGGGTVNVSANKVTTKTIQLERPSWFR